MEKSELRSEDIIKRRSIFYKAFSIYGEPAGFYDFGPIGLSIKRNIEKAWRKAVPEHPGFIEIEVTTLAPEPVFKASGHLSTFTDPIIVCSSCHSGNRADKILESFYSKKNDKAAMIALRKMDIKGMEAEIKKNRLKCEKCGTELTGKVEYFNLMFKSYAGQGTAEPMYLRPETAQGIFMDFKELYRLNSLKLPCAICQSGKAYRNEISPRQQLVRMREFTQMEAELFYDPKTDFKSTPLGEYSKSHKIFDTMILFAESGKDPKKISIKELIDTKKVPNEYFAFMIYKDYEFMKSIGFETEEYWFREIEKEELPHYSRCNLDVETETSYGTIEITGIADRGTFDLQSHSKLSGQDLSIMNGEEKILPSVAELSIGLDRILLAILEKKTVDDKERGWKWLKLEKRIAPYDYSIFPLQKDEKLVAMAMKISEHLRNKGLKCNYSDSASIGKRYAKSDEIGVANAITIDFQSLEDNTVTIRDRNTAEQRRIKWEEIA